jgi:hypothetical protein
MCFTSVDTKIQRNIPISLQDFIKINNEAIGIHQRFLKRKDDTGVTGTDLEHEFWIDFYEQAIEFVKGNPSRWTKGQIVTKYQEDANNHLRYINEGLTSDIVGGIAWQSKWYWRWIACADYVGRFVDTRLPVGDFIIAPVGGK